MLDHFFDRKNRGRKQNRKNVGYKHPSLNHNKCKLFAKKKRYLVNSKVLQKRVAIVLFDPNQLCYFCKAHSMGK